MNNNYLQNQIVERSTRHFIRRTGKQPYQVKIVKDNKTKELFVSSNVHVYMTNYGLTREAAEEQLRKDYCHSIPAFTHLTEKVIYINDSLNHKELLAILLHEYTHSIISHDTDNAIHGDKFYKTLQSLGLQIGAQWAFDGQRDEELGTTLNQDIKALTRGKIKKLKLLN